MVGFIVPNSSLNSFGSICYCLIAMGIHAYACYNDIVRYHEAGDRAWPRTGGEPPSEVTTLLGLTILSLFVLPFFCVASVIKVGNLANDGVKLGRDQDEKLKSSDEDSVKDKKELVGLGGIFKRKAKYLWKHFCPVAQTLHLVAAFLLLLPEVLLTAVEIRNGYKSADIAWESELDFLFPEERAMMSHIRSSVNLTIHPNATHFKLSSTRSTSGGWGDRISISISFVHFCIALACFLVRYASVFWYTNKALTLVFAFQLLSMVLNSIFGFNSFATLYCVCYNQKIFPNIHLSNGCGVDLTLYLISGAILLLSTITVFEYGSHYFHEKSKIVERNHATDTFTKRTVIVDSGCQAFKPHSCAMGALVAFAICKGPIIYDMVHLMRVTNDELMVSAVICEVCYMVTWVMLWFGMTVKQKWKFRILDYVTLQHVRSLPLEGSLVKMNLNKERGDSIDGGSLTRMKRLSNSHNVASRSLESNVNGTNSSCEERCPSDLGTDESDQGNVMAGAHVLRDPDGRQVIDTSSLRRAKGRRNAGARVTFNENSRYSSGNLEEEPAIFGSLNRRSSHHNKERTPEVSHVNVTADIHMNVPSSSSNSTQGDNSSQPVVMRRYSDHSDNPLNSEYRNSLRGKCGELYLKDANRVSSCDEDIDSPTDVPPMEPLPTLMSSFRDRVRESSLAAISFKERERHMMEHYHTYDEHITGQTNDDQCEHLDSIENHRSYNATISDENIADTHTQNHHPQQPHHHHQPQHNTNSQYPHLSDHNLSHTTDTSLKHQSLSSEEGQSTNHVANSTLESSDSGLPTVIEDAQLGRVRRGPRDDLVAHHHHPHHQQQPSQHPHHQYQQHQHPPQHPRPLMVKLGGKKGEIGRRDSANFSLTSSSQDTSSNESDHGQGLCSQV